MGRGLNSLESRTAVVGVADENEEKESHVWKEDASESCQWIHV